MNDFLIVEFRSNTFFYVVSDFSNKKNDYKIKTNALLFSDSLIELLKSSGLKFC